MNTKAISGTLTHYHHQAKKQTLVKIVEEQEQQTAVVQQQQFKPLPFDPPPEQRQSVGSTMGSYLLMGVGVSLGFAIVGAFIG